MEVVDRLRSAALTPGLVAFVASERVRRHRVGMFAAFQRVDPVHRSPAGVVVLSRHEDVAAVLRDPTFGSDERKADLSLLRLGMLERPFSSRRPARDAAAVEAETEFVTAFQRLMLFLDPPDHTRLRGLVAKAFTPKRVEQLRGRVTELVEELLEPLRGARWTELMAEFAYPLPARVICELLEVPADGVPLFLRESPKLAVSLDPGPMRTD